jgi:hypothetical protein
MLHVYRLSVKPCCQSNEKEDLKLVAEVRILYANLYSSLSHTRAYLDVIL